MLYLATCGVGNVINDDDEDDDDAYNRGGKIGNIFRQTKRN